MSRFLASIATLAVFATPITGQIPPGVGDLLALLPPDCLMIVQTEVIPCFAQNPECFEDLPTADDISALPSYTDIMTCDDITGPVCPILSRCEPCLEDLGSLLSCVLTGVEGIPQETVDLINGCALDCEDDMEDDMDGPIEGDMDDEMVDGNTTMFPSASPNVTMAPSVDFIESTDAPSVASPQEPATPPPAGSMAVRDVLSLSVIYVALTMSSFLLA